MVERTPGDLWAQILAAMDARDALALSASSPRFNAMLHRRELDATWVQLLWRMATGSTGREPEPALGAAAEGALRLDRLLAMRAELAGFFAKRAGRVDGAWLWLDKAAPRLVAPVVHDFDVDARTGTLVFIAGGELVVRREAPRADGARVVDEERMLVTNNQRRVNLVRGGAAVLLRWEVGAVPTALVELATMTVTPGASEVELDVGGDWTERYIPEADAAIIRNTRTGAEFQAGHLEVFADASTLVTYDPAEDVLFDCNVDTGDRTHLLLMPEGYRWPVKLSGRTLYLAGTAMVGALDLDTRAVAEKGPLFTEDTPYIVDDDTYVGYYPNMYIVQKGRVTHALTSMHVDKLGAHGRKVYFCVKQEAGRPGALYELELPQPASASPERM